MNYDITYFNGNFHGFFVQMDRTGTLLGAFTTCKETPVQMKPTVKSLVCCVILTTIHGLQYWIPQSAYT